MVLDAPLEHSLPEVHQVATEIIAAEESFNRFADWCPTQETCALRGQDVRAVFDRLVQQADQNPIQARRCVAASHRRGHPDGHEGFAAIQGTVDLWP